MHTHVSGHQTRELAYVIGHVDMSLCLWKFATWRFLCNRLTVIGGLQILPPFAPPHCYKKQRTFSYWSPWVPIVHWIGWPAIELPSSYWQGDWCSASFHDLLKVIQPIKGSTHIWTQRVEDVYCHSTNVPFSWPSLLHLTPRGKSSVTVLYHFSTRSFRGEIFATEEAVKIRRNNIICRCCK